MFGRGKVFVVLAVAGVAAAACAGRSVAVDTGNGGEGAEAAKGGSVDGVGGSTAHGARAGSGNAAHAGGASAGGARAANGGSTGGSVAASAGEPDEGGAFGMGAVSGEGPVLATGGATSMSSGGDAGSAGDAGGGPVEVACGDGVVSAGEACDDGNRDDDDGCDSDCQVEAASTCTAPVCEGGARCALVVPVVFRDFIGHGLPGGHPDFAPGSNSSGAVQGLVAEQLDGEGKPVQTSLASAAAAGGYMHGQAAFAQWYRDEAPSGGAIRGELVLWDDGSGTGRYVNRWGAHGEPWDGRVESDAYEPITYGGPGGTGCEGCAPTSTGACYDPCTPWGNASTQACCAEVPAEPAFDGNPLFFPIDVGDGLLEEPRTEGKVPEAYGFPGYPWEDAVAGYLGIDTPIETACAPFPSETHNFNFTTQATYWFRYDPTKTYGFELGSDDDGWLFINGHLAIDLGGWHMPLEGRATLSNGVLAVSATLKEQSSPVVAEFSAESFGLEVGHVYPIAIFAAEREAESSVLKVALSGVAASGSICVPTP